MMRKTHEMIARECLRPIRGCATDQQYREVVDSVTEALQRAFDLGFKAAGGSIYPLNEDPSGQRREPMSPHPLDDEPPFEIQEAK